MNFNSIHIHIADFKTKKRLASYSYYIAKSQKIEKQIRMQKHSNSNFPTDMILVHITTIPGKNQHHPRYWYFNAF